MSTNDVPGANPANRDKLAMGCWAEHSDGSLILVESVEPEGAGPTVKSNRVVYSIFDLGLVQPVEYRDAMPEDGFKKQFSWKADRGAKVDDEIRWTWHDKKPFPWERVFDDFPAGQRMASAVATRTAAQKVADSIGLRAQELRDRTSVFPSPQPIASSIMSRIKGAIDALIK